jgi:hypothetical protein
MRCNAGRRIGEGRASDRSCEYDQVTVAGEHRINGQKLKRLGNRLSKQQSIKWIGMVQWKFGDSGRMHRPHRQFHEAARIDRPHQFIHLRVDSAQAGLASAWPGHKRQ